jgi:hypothetical protein
LPAPCALGETEELLEQNAPSTLRDPDHAIHEQIFGISAKLDLFVFLFYHARQQHFAQRLTGATLL